MTIEFGYLFIFAIPNFFIPFKNFNLLRPILIEKKKVIEGEEQQCYAPQTNQLIYLISKIFTRSR